MKKTKKVKSKQPAAVRKTYIRALPTPEQQQHLDGIIKDVLERAALIMEHQIKHKHTSYDVRNKDRSVSTKEGKPDKDFAKHYDLVMKDKFADRGIRGPYVLPDCETALHSKNPSKLDLQSRALIAKKKLPIKLPKLNRPKGYDYAAFQVGVASLKSWHECNEKTKDNYKKQEKAVQKLRKAVQKLQEEIEEQAVKVAAIQPDLDICTFLEKWLEKHNLYLTKRVADKFRKYGWTTRLSNYPFEELRACKDDTALWHKAMLWKVQLNRFNNMRPTSAVNFPGQVSRDIPFGTNSRKFQLSFEKGRLYVTIDNHKIATLPSLYFKNLTISPKGNNYEFEYDRGNKSPFPEHVVATLKEITLYKKSSGHYYFGLPLNVNIPHPSKETEDFINYFWSTEEQEEVPPVKIMGVDLGVTNPAACVVVDETGAYIDSFFATEVRNEKFRKGLLETRALINEVYKVLDVFGGEVRVGVFDGAKVYSYSCPSPENQKVLEEDGWECQISGSKYETTDMEVAKGSLEKLGLPLPVNGHYNVYRDGYKRPEQKYYESPEWMKHWKVCDRLVADVKRKFLRTCCWVDREERAVATETLLQIIVYKKYLGLLQRWTYIDKPPVKKGEPRKGFESHYRRLNNLKRDFRKKIGCAIVRLARQHGVSVLAIENLEHCSPDETKSSYLNEISMLWGNGQIARWIEHFAEQYGIKVLSMDPRLTSQTDPETNQLGARDNYDKEKLYIERNGKIVTIHADLAAAQNLALRVAHKRFNEPFLKVCRIDGGYALWWKEEKEDAKDGQKDAKDESNSMKRRKYVLTQRFGNHMLMVGEDGQIRPMKSAPIGKSFTYLNEYPDGWWPDAIRKKRQKFLREMVVKEKVLANAANNDMMKNQNSETLAQVG